MKLYYTNKSQKTSVVSIIINPEINSEEDHIKLLNITRTTDTLFLFSQNKVNRKKFSNLYRATFYAIPEQGQTETEYVWETLEYIKELESYNGICLIRNMREINLENLKKLGESIIETSIWKPQPLTWKEMMDIYKLPDSKFKKFPLIYSFLCREKDNTKMNTSHTTQDSMMFFRYSTISKLQDFFKQYPEYIESFRISPYEEFLTSSVMQICPESLLKTVVKNAET